jgi:LuxR family maltose regulon positive regulatory protein
MFTGALTKIYIRSRKIAAAEELLHFHHIRSDGLFQHPHEVEFTSLAYLLLAKGDLKAANDLFTRLLEWAKEAKNTGWAISLLAGLALVYHANGDDRHALETLDQALEFAEPEGFFQTFLQEGEAMADLLSEIARRGTHRDYALRLLAAFPVTSLQSPAARLVLKQNRAIQEPAVPIEPLSEREIKVITFIAAGLSNKEIAQRLCVSLRTVKYHTTSIYIKLNVNGRAQAAIKAKELGLIE